MLKLFFSTKVDYHFLYDNSGDNMNKKFFAWVGIAILSGLIMGNIFYKQYEKEKEKYKRPNILICGYTGSGKTSIIQSLLGEDLVPADKIGAGLPVTQDYEMYENELVRIWDSQGLEPDKGEYEFIERTKKFISEIQNRPNVDDHIHIF